MSKLEPHHTLFDSVEEMLAPETLSQLLLKSVTRVTCQPMNGHSGLSGSLLSYVQTNAGRFVLKQMSVATDWSMKAREDKQSNSVKLWQYGLLDQLLPHLEHKIIACSRDGIGWAILMHDLQDRVFDGWERTIPKNLVPVFLDRLANLHATFWNDPRLNDPCLGLSDGGQRLKWTNLARVSRNNDPLEKIPAWNDVIRIWIKEGWEIMAEQLDRDVYFELSRLRDDPQPLLKALERYPSTLIHGDYRTENLAHLESDQLVAIDWQQATRSLMTVDLAWFTSQWIPNLQAIGETKMQNDYRERLEVYLGRPFKNTVWQAMLNLGSLYNVLLSTSFLAYWSKHGDDPESRDFLEMLLKKRNQQVRDGMRWLVY